MESVVYDENLPWKYVHTGVNYFAFAETETSKPYICSCQKESLVNRLELFMRYHQYDTCLNEREWLLLEKKLKLSMYYDNKIKESKLPYGMDWIDKLEFKEGLCHLCNCVTPTTAYTNYIYTTKLEQRYGHYISNHFYEYGISNTLPDFYGIYFLEEKVPGELLSIIRPSKEDILLDIKNFYGLSKAKIKKIEKNLDKIFSLPTDKRYILLYKRAMDKYLKDNSLTYVDLQETNKIDDECYSYIHKVIWKRYLSLKKIVTDEVKSSFKLKKWVNESLLANLIKELFKDLTIYRNYRPEILEGLELDVYIRELNVGIEYQGIQHEKPVKLWGGEEALSIRIANDKRKAKLCKKYGIELIYFWYYEDINKELVIKKLGKYIE